MHLNSQAIQIYTSIALDEKKLKKKEKDQAVKRAQRTVKDDGFLGDHTSQHKRDEAINLSARAEALSWARTERCCCRPEDCGPDYWRIGGRKG